MPPAAARFQQLLMGQGRLTVFKHLLQNECVTRDEIAASTGLTPPTISKALRELEHLGLVKADIDYLYRPGRTVKYAAEREIAKQANDHFANWLFERRST